MSNMDEHALEAVKEIAIHPERKALAGLYGAVSVAVVVFTIIGAAYWLAHW
jgi:hypothetical protein